MSDRADVEGAVWGILRQIYLRTLTAGDPGALRDAGAENELLDRWHPDMEQDLHLLLHCMDVAVAGRLSALQERLHQGALDDDLVDQAVAFAATWDGDPGEPIDV